MDHDSTQAQVAALARQIRVELVSRSMLHQDLADAIPVSHSAMSHYMTALRPIPMPTFIRIAEVLGVKPSELLGRAAELPPERAAGTGAALP
ncbi:MAG TPA: helix-turn-helix transcriptional regulator [Arthrobacter sp.]